MNTIFKKVYKGKIRRTTLKRFGSYFHISYFPKSKDALITKQCKTQTEAETLLIHEGYKIQMTRVEYSAFQKSESLKRIRIWLLERSHVLNFEGISKKSGIKEKRFKTWLVDTKKELTGLQYNKLRACIKILKGS